MEARVRIVGLNEVRRELRRVSPAMAKKLQVAHKAISTDIAEKSRSRMAGLPGPRSSKAAQGIRPRGGQKSAQIALLGSNEFVRAFEFGTRKHMVFGRPVAASSMRRRVFPPWQGNQWNAGEGPARGVGYAVQPTIRENVNHVWDTYTDRLEDAFAGAFPTKI